MSSSEEVVRWQIRVSGVVQGVGFRPFVYKLAVDRDLAGWVLNDPLGVLIEFEGPYVDVARTVADLTELAPPQARIDQIESAAMPLLMDPPDRFAIRESTHGGAKTTVVATDSNVCTDCLRELREPTDRRFGYPFINCTNCGPRYSIVRRLPYDRPHTTMATFTMCAVCAAEYTNPLDRRYHAQPNACRDCGPSLTLVGRDGVVAAGDAALAQAGAALIAGKIVAIKGIGGFHLAVNARNAGAVAGLRTRKRRDSKPFAVMAGDLAAVSRIAWIDNGEAELLVAQARPIVLVRKRAGALPDNIAPRNPNLGVMLPSAPYHHLLLDTPGLDLLVMTSGNISGYPIAYRNEDAVAQLFDVSELILMHDRDIHTRVDDSIVRRSSHEALEEPIVSLIRRARGYAPYPVDVNAALPPMVAYGAELKTTVAVTDGARVYLSQHIGDLKNDETFQSHQAAARHLAGLYDLTPQVAVCDLHPQFRSTRFALADETIAETHQVQHHHAHMAACMAENRLVGPVIGVVFDGSGYGPDATIWGGEFLVGDYVNTRRAARLRRLPLLGGDQAVRHPIRTGFALAYDVFGSTEDAVAAFPALAVLDEQRLDVFATMTRRGINSPQTSSMGRLFDAVAALLGVCDRAEYEAQGPIELEGLLGRDLSMSELDARYVFQRKGDGDTVELDPRPVLRALSEDLAEGVGVETLSRRFHSAVVRMVVAECQHIRGDEELLSEIVFSGGVFLNEFLLVNCLVEARGHGFTPYCHTRVPTNDGGIALGQVMVAAARRSVGRNPNDSGDQL